MLRSENEEPRIQLGQQFADYEGPLDPPVDGEEQDEPEPEESECSGCPGQGINCADECIKPRPTQEPSDKPRAEVIVALADKIIELFQSKNGMESQARDELITLLAARALAMTESKVKP